LSFWGIVDDHEINFGLGGEALENYINVDINPRSTEVDVVCNFDVYPCLLNQNQLIKY